MSRHKKDTNLVSKPKIKKINLITLSKSLVNVNGKKNGRKTLMEYGFNCPNKGHKQNKYFVDIFKTDKKFDLIYADPPWKYLPSSKKRCGAINGLYPTMTTHDICKMPVNRILKGDAILLLWSTAVFLPDAFKVIDAWGFTYVTLWLNWNKTYTRHAAYLGMGTYSRNGIEHVLYAYKKNITEDITNKHKFFPSGYHLVENYDGHGNKKIILDETEYLLMGKKGNVLKYRVQDQGKIPSNIFEWPVDRKHHSRKPHKIYDIIKKTFTHCKAPLELFARNNKQWSTNKYWSVWGNDCKFI